MLLSIFRFCKTLICPTTTMFQEAGPRILLNPIQLSLLLNRLEFSNRQTSRLQRRVRIGSTVVLTNVLTKERLKFRIVKEQKSYPDKGIVSFMSIIGVALLGLQCGDVAHLKTSKGEFEWQLIAVNQNDQNMID